MTLFHILKERTQDACLCLSLFSQFLLFLLVTRASYLFGDSATLCTCVYHYKFLYPCIQVGPIHYKETCGALIY